MFRSKRQEFKRYRNTPELLDRAMAQSAIDGKRKGIFEVGGSKYIYKRHGLRISVKVL